MNTKKYIKIIICLWLVIIAGCILKSEYTLNFGREILLKTVPVDPRDLIKGDYVILNFTISNNNRFKNYSYGDEVYVSLGLDNKNIAFIDSVSSIKPSDRLFMKGKVSKCQAEIPFFRFGKCVEYGIESYYVKEGTGRKLENELRDGTLVKVKVDKFGNAKVKGFVKD